MKPIARLNKRTIKWNPNRYWDDSELYWDLTNIYWDEGIAIENLEQNLNIRKIISNSKVDLIKPNSR